MEQFKNIQEEITNHLVNGFAEKLESLVIEGLKRKGFEFETKKDLEDFAMIHLRCEDNIHFKEKIYYIDDIPFFLHNYNTDFSMPIEENRSFKMTANYGSYSFL